MVRKIGTNRGSPKYINFRYFKNFNKEAFLYDIKHTDWHIGFNDVNELWLTWKTKFQESLDKHAPMRTKKARNKPSPWLTKELKQAMFSRDNIKKKALQSNSPSDWLCYKQERNRVNHLIKKTKKDYYQNEIKKQTGNLKGTWKVLNDVIGKKTKNIEINKLNLASKCVTSTKEIADSLNTHFTNIGPKLLSEIPSSSTDRCFEDYLTKTANVFSFTEIE